MTEKNLGSKFRSPFHKNQRCWGHSANLFQTGQDSQSQMRVE